MTEMSEVEAIKARVNEIILDHGVAVQATTSEAGVGYAYTIGRTLHGRPELVLSGLPIVLMHELLMRAVELDADDPIIERRPFAGVIDSYPVFPIEVDPWSAPLHMALACFGKVTALQLLWPDDGGRYPGDPDYANDPTTQQVF